MKSSFLRSARPYVAGVVLAIAGTLTAGAIAHGGPPHGGPMGGPGEMSMLSPRALDRMLDRVDANAEQRSRIKAISSEALKDLKAQREATRELRERSISLFTQPTVDANAIEAARQQLMQQQDATSRRISQALIDASQVLTPEQRQKLAERMNQRRERMERHREERRDAEPAQPRS